jgi:PAS domain S-box-containing protein
MRAVTKDKAADLRRTIAELERRLEERGAELAEALTQQSAIAEVLEVINRSTFDLGPVLETVTTTAARLCGAEMGFISRREGDGFRFITGVGATRETSADALRLNKTLFAAPPLVAGRGTITGRVVLEGRPVQIADITADPEYTLTEAMTLGKIRTILGVPLMREGEPIGTFTLARRRVEPFTERQIELVRSFADQAAIAIENARLLTELRQSLDRQTATAEVLRVINSSPGDLAPVFDAILESAHNLCGVSHGNLQLYDGERLRAVAVHGLATAHADLLRQGYRPGPNMADRPLLEGARYVQASDLGEVDDPLARAAFELSGIRTCLYIPLRKDGVFLGRIAAARREVKPFTENEIALLESFAAQAVIAMENARLMTETRDALEQQTATADVLQVINSSPGELEPVFETMLANAVRLCEAKFGNLSLYDGEAFKNVALHNAPPGYAGRRGVPFRPHAESGLARVARTKQVVQIADLRREPQYLEGNPAVVAIVDVAGARTIVIVPMLKENELVGTISIYRQEVRPFTDRQIELVNNFARQAVIAIENARLLKELREREAELARSVDELTATGDVLKIISRSSVDLEAVLDTLVETVARLCRADQARMFRRRDDAYDLVASCGISEEAKAYFRAHPLTADRGTITGCVALERRPVHVADLLEDPDYTYRGIFGLTGARTILGIPLLREDALLGIFILVRTRVEPFSDNEIELAASFADQAVIAIENARLFEELRERQAELRVTFDNMGDGVAMFDAEARLAAWNRNFQELLELPDDFLAKRPSFADYFRYLAARGEYGSADLEAELSRSIQDSGLKMRFERTRPDGRVIEVRRNPVPGGGFVVIFSDITERKRAEAAVGAARDAAETALRDLQAAQASLLHAQKMAALGQLTAGIAHEIKNPLNFVNNFAGLSNELLTELKDIAAPALAALADERRADLDETIAMLTGNLAKIAEHGRRADGIVKSMLAHSRGGSGDWQSADLNVLVDEALNLAFHGARAQDQSFNVTMERDFDRSLAPIEVVPQDMTRVFLNIIGNGFYAATRRKRDGDGAFRPVLRVATRDFGNAVEIRVRDNGIGISPEHRDRLFQPFFTTKPTGEGTGLGLSISYDIVTQQHGGSIGVDSEVGAFTEFTVRLPRRRHVAGGRSA